MVFNSLSYFVFLPLVFLLFSVVKDRYRWLILLLSSFVFYGFILKPILLAALTAVILVTFRIGGLIEQSENRSKRHLYLWTGIIINLSLLIYFKYLPFIVENLDLFFCSVGVKFVLAKPVPLVSVGLSFYIFTAISYLTDIYFRMIKPEIHFGYFSLHIAFFPKLMQGPIERAGDLIPQLKAKYEFNYNNMRFGILLFTWGLFKKVVIADRLGLYVDAVYNDVYSFAGLPLLLAAYSYAFQIFMDFSGYTDMALGSARLFNINLAQNFNNPFFSTSMADFWRRWHISFSRWILDYIFEPLQMTFRNMGKLGTVAALVTAFILAGIWHGANWTFFVFGLIHGIYLATAYIYKPYQKKLYKALGIQKSMILKIWQIFVTFNLLSLAWVFFRAKSMPDAFYIVTHLHVGVGIISDFLYLNGRIELFITIITLGIALFLDSISRSEKFEEAFIQKSALQRWCVYFVLALSTLFLALDSENLFIYTQF